MKKNLLVMLLIMFLLLVACQDAGDSAGTEQTAPDVETAVPATDAPSAPAEEAPTVPTETAEAAAGMPQSEPTDAVPDTAVPAALPAELTAQLDAFLQSQVYSEGGNPEGAAPGLVLLVDTPDGTYLKAAGVSSLEDGTPMQVDDRLEIGSNTKSFTIAVLM
ncbi:MAG: serine hydrolase, partial [Candidatus Promineifilaceae bacterium]